MVHVGELADGPLERGEGLDAAHVADVRAHPGVPACRQTEGVLELASSRQCGAGVARQAHRERGVATRAPDRQFLVVVDADHRVVARNVDGAVVDQPGVDDAAQAAPGVVVVVADRLVCEVAAGHDEQRRNGCGCAGNGPEEQVVQRGVRQQHADVRVAGRHQRRQR